MVLHCSYPDRDLIARETAKILLETNSVMFNAEEPFTYTSGRVGPVYTDCRRLISFPHARAVLMDFAVSTLVQNAGYEAFDYIAGGETAGIPYAAFIAERFDLPMLYVRKKPKGFGAMAQIEGCMEKGKKVLLVEDLSTDGGSKILFIDALRKAKAIVEHAFVIFNYGGKSIKTLENVGVNLHSLTTWADLLELVKSENRFDTNTIMAVEDFLNDPVGWSNANGGGK